MNCGMKCVKWLLFGFNLLFWILGIVLLIVGVMSRTKSSSWKELVADTFMLSAANIVIAAGVFVAIIGFLGCCGAMQENTCMIVSYAICIVLIFILELGGAIYAYTKTDSLQAEITKGITQGVNETYGLNDTETNKDITKAIDWFQQEVECCGTNAPSSWTKSRWHNEIDTKHFVPESCCIGGPKDGCNSGKLAKLISDEKIFKKGCVPEGVRFVKDTLYAIGGVAIGIGVVQLLGIIFACCLCNAIKNDS